MNTKSFTYNDLFDEGAAFFDMNGNATMVLTAKAAKEVCAEATNRGRFIGIVEGGYWHNPGFQPDMSRRWDSKTRLEQEGNFKRNNELAIENIDEDASEGYTAFLITLIK